jgi:lectin, mannose-binding 1
LTKFQIKLPSGYFFGISAASAEIPDSFEAFKFILSTPTDGESQPAPPSSQNLAQEQKPFSDGDSTKDEPASKYTTQPDQFADLHNRLQIMNHALSNLFREISSLSGKVEAGNNELTKRGSVSPDQLSTIEKRLSAIERNVDAIRRDVEGKDYRGQLDKLQDALRDTHTSLNDVMPHIFNEIVSTSAPRMGLFVFILICFQLGMAGAYVWYKRRRANAPKKYL